MLLRINWETTGLTSHYALLASGETLYKLEESLEYTKDELEQRTFMEAPGEEDATFIGQMDREAVLTLAKLSADVESFTLRELKQIHRRSRVAIEAGMTNNRHIHKQVTKLLEKHVVFDSEEQRQGRFDIARKEAMVSYRAALERCSSSHNKLRDAEKQKLDAEEEYIEAMMELNRVDKEKKKVVCAIETQHVSGGRRRRTTSM